MNLIVNGFMHEKQEEILRYLEMHTSIDKCCIITDREYKRNKNSTDVFIVQDIIRGDYSCYGDLGPEEISYINIHFFQLMEMMNRFYAYLHKDFSYEEKKSIIYKHFAFWMKYIKENNIDRFISSNIPHDIYDYIILLSMQFNGKKENIYFLQTQFKDMISPMTSIEEQDVEIKREYEKNSNQENCFLTKCAQIEWDLENNCTIPFYMKKKNCFQMFFTILKKLKRFSLKKLIVTNDYRRKIRKLSNEYTKCCQNIDLEQEFIYFPLHYQPEMTSCMLGPTFVNQYLLIKFIDSNLPEGWRLYVKEHPKQEFCNRYLNYYLDIKKNTKNTYFVNKKIPSSELIKNCRTVATISGTAGWEALFHKKTVLLFGSNFYQYAPGVYKINSKKDFVNSINSIANSEFDYSEIKLKHFLNAVEKVSIHGFVDSVYCNNSNFSFEESNQNIIIYLKEWLEKNEN